MEEYIKQLDAILSNLFRKYQKTVKDPGVLLSGGIDSSTISTYVSRHFSTYTLLSMGTSQTKDRPFIEIMSKFLNYPFEWIEITPESVSEHIKTVSSLLQKKDIEPSAMQISLAMGYFLTFMHAHKLGITQIVTGQGPDILFAGYHKYKTSENINADIKKDLTLLETDKKRDGAMAAYFGITLINPYLEKEVVDFSLTVPPEYKIKNGVEKYVLRQLAIMKGLPSEIINRPKKAFQYSTGVQKVVTDIL